MNGANEQMTAFANAQSVQTSSQFSYTLIAECDAGYAPRRADILIEHPGELYGQRLRFATARTSKRYTVML